MVKIIQRGTLPSEREYQSMCRKCGTVFEWVAAEGTVHSDQRDGDYITIGCPLCGETVTTAVGAYKKSSSVDPY